MNIYLQLLLGRQLFSRQPRFIGKLCLRQGRKRILLLSNIGTSIGWLIFLFALYLPAKDSFSVYIPLPLVRVKSELVHLKYELSSFRDQTAS